MIFVRLAPRLRALGIRDCAEYVRRLELDDAGEMQIFVNLMTTNMTAFFRHQTQFDIFQQALRELAATKPPRAIHIWSAGCATGEEAYSIAWLVHTTIPGARARGIRVLATDVATSALDTAAAGIYDAEKIDAIDARYPIAEMFLRGTGGNTGKYVVKTTLRSLVTFRRLNLIDDWPLTGPFDFIFCRNVALYFDPATQQQVFDRFARLQPAGGYLFTGQSELIAGLPNHYQGVRHFSYRRSATAGHATTNREEAHVHGNT